MLQKTSKNAYPHPQKAPNHTNSTQASKHHRLALKLKENMVKRKIQKKNRSECDKI